MNHIAWMVLVIINAVFIGVGASAIVPDRWGKIARYLILAIGILVQSGIIAMAIL